MLMFYEQNNIAAFKKIFIEQYLFAVKTYFWWGRVDWVRRVKTI
jgi:hypothetical protein